MPPEQLGKLCHMCRPEQMLPRLFHNEQIRGSQWLPLQLLALPPLHVQPGLVGPQQLLQRQRQQRPQLAELFRRCHRAALGRRQQRAVPQ